MNAEIVIILQYDLQAYMVKLKDFAAKFAHVLTRTVSAAKLGPCVFLHLRYKGRTMQAFRIFVTGTGSRGNALMYRT